MKKNTRNSAKSKKLKATDQATETSLNHNSLGVDISNVDTNALRSVASLMFMDKVSKKIKLSFSEWRTQKHELIAQAKEQKKKIASIRKQLKNRDRKLSSQTLTSQIARKTAKDITSYIGYNAMYEDGICEVEQGLFSVSCSFSDTSYQSMRDDLQKGMFAGVNRLYDQFCADTVIQMSIINTPLLPDEIGARSFFDLSKISNENARNDAKVFNEILNQKMKESVSNIRRERYITFMVGASSAEKAVPKLVRLQNESSRILNSMGSSLKILDGKERLKVLHSQLRPNVPFAFDYKHDLSIRQGLTTKDAIAPLILDFKPDGRSDSFKSDEVWGQILVMRKFGSELSDRALSDIVNLPIPMNVTWFVQPIDKTCAIKYVREKIAWQDKEIIDEQGSALRRGYDMNLLPLELKYSKEETEDVLDHLQNKNQHLYDFTGLIYTYSNSREILDNQILQIISSARQNSIEVDLLYYRQREALNSILPLGQNHISISRKFTTAQLSILMPFATQELDEREGNYYGQNKYSNNLVIGNRRRLSSPVAFISGKPGSGKSMFVKNEITGTIFSRPNDEIYILDRAGEYTVIAERYGGITQELSVKSNTYLNPFDTVDVADKTREEQIAFKIDALLAQASASATEAGQNLTEVEQSIIARCVELAYIKSSESKNGKKSLNPTLGDFYEILLDQDEVEAKIIALRYERFVKGSMSFFNNESNIKWKRITDINFKELPDSMLVFGLISACEAIRNRMYANFNKGKRTWLYIEEVQSIFKYPTVLNYFARFANEGRKFGLFLTGITQNSIAMFENASARNLVLNADFIMLLKQSPIDRMKWVEILNLSAQEEECIDESVEPGDGLLIFGKSGIPISGRLQNNNILYEIFSTNPSEREENSLLKCNR